MKLLKKILLGFSLTLLSIITQGQNIYPGSVGYGTDSKGAYEGSSTPTILTVDTLSASNISTGTYSGSFEWALKQTYPRIIVFEVGGVIDYSSTDTRSIWLSNPYCNVYGQTAPSPGITLQSATLGLNSGAHDMLFQHIAIRYGDAPTSSGNVEISDCFTALPGSYNIVLDHCSFSWALDENIGAYSAGLTFSNSLIYEPYHYSYHLNESGSNEPEKHGYGVLSSTGSGKTFYNNFFGWNVQRNPMNRADNLAYINNYVFANWSTGLAIWGNTSEADAAVVGNNFYPTPNETSGDRFMELWYIPSTSMIYYSDNNCEAKDEGEPLANQIKYNNCSCTLSNILSEDSVDNVIDISDYTIINADDVDDSLYVNAGMRPWDRDFYDSIALIKFANRQQDFINSRDALPAKAYNRDPNEGLRTTAGNMSNGYNFSTDPTTFTVNGSTVYLNTNCTNQQQVLDAINEDLPTGFEAIDHPGKSGSSYCSHIIIQTTTTGSDKYITIGGDASVFGIPNGTQWGSDAIYPSYTYPSTSATVDIPDNPHDDSGNGFTNLQVWADTIASSSSGETPPNTEWIDIDTVYTDYELPGAEAVNSIDGNLTTIYSTDSIDGATVFVLDAVYDLDSVLIYFTHSATRTADFKLGGSTDSVNYTYTDTITSSITSTFESFVFNDTAKYVSFINFGNSTGTDWASIYQVRIYGSVYNAIEVIQKDSIEAENMNIVGDDVAAVFNSYSSNDTLVYNTIDNGSYSVYFTWIGSSGIYNISTFYFDENDGLGTYYLKVDNDTIHTWIADQDLGSAGRDINRTVEVADSVTVDSLSQITLIVNGESGDRAATDLMVLDLLASITDPIPSDSIVLDSAWLNFDNISGYTGDWRNIDDSSDSVKISLDNGWYLNKHGITWQNSSGYIPNVYPNAVSSTSHYRDANQNVLVYSITGLDSTKQYYIETLSSRIDEGAPRDNIITINDSSQIIDASDNTTLLKWSSVSPIGDSIAISIDTVNGADKKYINGLKIVEYQIIVSCDTVTINITADITNSTGYEYSNGSIVLTVSGGFTPYTYLWYPDGEITKDIYNKAAGDYTVFITDDNLCAKDSLFTIGIRNPSLDTITAGVDTLLKNWSNKVNSGIAEYNTRTTSNLQYLQNERQETYSTWATKANYLIKGFPTIATDTINKNTDNLGVFRLKSNAAIYLESITE
jgi:hypothetical protein